MKLHHCQLDLEYKLASFLCSSITVFITASKACRNRLRYNKLERLALSYVTILKSPTTTGPGIPLLVLTGLHYRSKVTQTNRSRDVSTNIDQSKVACRDGPGMLKGTEVASCHFCGHP